MVLMQLKKEYFKKGLQNTLNGQDFVNKECVCVYLIQSTKNRMNYLALTI